MMPRWVWAVGTVFAVLAAGALSGVEMDASASTQQCNTECQSKMTDCILACDGMRSCEEACKKKGQSCVSLCTSDAGAPRPVANDAPSDAIVASDAIVDRAMLDGRAMAPTDAPARAVRNR